MTDYFAHHPPIPPSEPILGQQSTDLSNPDSNKALSIWNPTYNTPSPNTLLASLFGSQPVDPFPSASIFDMNPFDPQHYDPILNPTSKPDQTVSSIDMDSHKFFSFSPFADIVSRPNNGVMAGFDQFTLDNSGSSGSTPISLNGDTAYDSNFASFVQPEFRNRPEHPAYLYQLQMLENPDQLAPYFPSLEQRHQVRSEVPSRFCDILDLRPLT